MATPQMLAEWRTLANDAARATLIFMIAEQNEEAARNAGRALARAVRWLSRHGIQPHALQGRKGAMY